jgi:uncharacterized protein
MPLVGNAPDVYIQERDESLYSPSPSPTAVGLIGTATKGPFDVATLITSQGELVDTFGTPRTKDYGLLSAVELLKATRLLYFVRIGSGQTKGGVTIKDDGSGPTAAAVGPSSNAEPFNLLTGSTEPSPGTRRATARITYDIGAGADVNDVQINAVQATTTNGSGAATYNLSGIAGGSAVTITVSIDGGPVQTITFASSDSLISNFAAVTPEEVSDVINDQIIGGEARFSGNVVTIASDVFGSASRVNVTGGTANGVIGFTTGSQSGSGDVANFQATLASELKTAIEAVDAEIDVIVGVTGTVKIATTTTGVATSITLVSANSTIFGAAPRVNLTPLDSAQSGTASTASQDTVTLNAKTDGSHSSSIAVVVADSLALAGTKRVSIRFRGVTVETFDKLYHSPTPVTGGLPLVTTINSGDAASGTAGSAYVTATDAGGGATENPKNGTSTLSVGLNGDSWTAGTVIGTSVGGVDTGLEIFRNPDTLGIRLLATPGISFSSVIAEALSICEARADCLYVADAPKGINPADVVKWHNGDNSITVTVSQEGITEANATAFDSSFGAVYYPFLQVFDAFNETEVFIPPSAFALRSMVRTDQVADPWFAPAGPNRSETLSVRDLEFNPSIGQQEVMYQPGNNINTFINRNGVGVFLNGQKTLQRASTALDRINVRRLLITLEDVIRRAVTFLLFEPNDPTMWRRFVNLVSPVLEDAKQRRGITDYLVVADSSTTTDVLINQNTFLGKIFINPTRSAEKIIVAFVLTPSGVDFNEFIQA